MKPPELIRFMLLALALSTPCALPAVTLTVRAGTALPGTGSEVVITASDAESPVGALVFAVGYDATRLRFDGTAKDGQLSNVSVAAPAGYSTSASLLPTSEGESIAISIWRNGRTVRSIGGEIVRLRFETWHDAAGSAWVGIRPGASAASVNGDLLAVHALDGAVTIDSGTGLPQLNQSQLDFGGVRSGTSVERRLYILNSGTAPVQIRSVDVVGNGYAAPALDLPVWIAPASAMALPVTFTAGDDGHWRGSITVSTDRPQSTLVAQLVASVGSDQSSPLPSRSALLPLLPAASGTRTVLIVQQPANEPASVTVSISTDNETISRTLQLEARGTLVVSDLEEFLGVSIESPHRVELRSTDRAVRMTATWTADGDPSSSRGLHLDLPYRSDLPLERASRSFIHAGEPVQVLIASAEDDAAPYRVVLFDDQGREIQSTTLDVPSGSMLATVEVAGEIPAGTPLSVHVVRLEGTAPVAAWILTGSGSPSEVLPLR